MFIGSSIASAQQSWLKLREAQTMDTFEHIVSVVAVPGNEERPPQVRHYPAGNLIGPVSSPRLTRADFVKTNGMEIWRNC